MNPHAPRPFPPSAFTGFFGTMSRTDFLLGIRKPRSFSPLVLRTALMSDPTGSQLFYLTYLVSSTLPSSQAPEEPCQSRLFDWFGVACYNYYYIGLLVWYNYYGAQSLQRIVFGSVSPYPTLRTGVTVSLPRTRYRRFARPFPAGLYSCNTLITYKDWR